MKELKNRIKGLSAILLAVSLALCLVMGMPGTQASASDYSINLLDVSGNNIKNDDGNVIYTTYDDCVNNKTHFSAGTGWVSYSGGYFVINETNSDSAIISYITTSEKQSGTPSDTSHSSIDCYGKSIISSGLPNNCEYVEITACSLLDGYTCNGYGIYSLTLTGVYKTTSLEVGKATPLTAGTQYAFPSGSSTHKVKGDPTVYHSTSFYVPSDGTYTILQ